MVSTADCKKFITDFFRRNPQILRTWNDPTVQAMAEDPKNWERRYKCKPGNDHYDSLYRDTLDGNDDYLIFVDGAPGNRGMDGHKTMYPNQFAVERGFDCDPLEGQLSFIVLEDQEETLYLGTYIGD